MSKRVRSCWFILVTKPTAVKMGLGLVMMLSLVMEGLICVEKGRSRLKLVPLDFDNWRKRKARRPVMTTREKMMIAVGRSSLFITLLVTGSAVFCQTACLYANCTSSDAESVEVECLTGCNGDGASDGDSVCDSSIDGHT